MFMSILTSISIFSFQGWVDDFGVAGPAPDSAKLSWDKVRVTLNTSLSEWNHVVI